MKLRNSSVFPNKLTKLLANEVSVTFGFKPVKCRHFTGKRTMKTRNLEIEVESD